MTNPIALPPALAALAQRMTLSPDQWATYGHLDLLVDNGRLVRLRPGRHGGDVVMEVRVASLPTPERERETLLSRALLRVTAGASSQVGTLALSADAEYLLLQAEVDGSDSQVFADSFESFLNEMDYWIAVADSRG